MLRLAQSAGTADDKDGGSRCDPELEALNQRGKLLAQEGRIAEALPITDQVARLTKGKSGCEELFHTIALLNLKFLYDEAVKKVRQHVKSEEYSETVLLLEPLVESFKSRFGQDSKQYSNAREDLNRVYGAHERQFDGLYREFVTLHGEKRFDEALARAEKIAEAGRAFERRAPDRYGDALTLLAESYIELGRFTDAVPRFEKAVDLIESVYGGNSSDAANRRERLGAIYAAMGYRNEAEEQYKRALAIRERDDLRPPPEEDVARSLHTLGMHYLGQGRQKEAEPLLRRAVEIAQSVADRAAGGAPGLDGALKELGVVNTIKGNLADALNNLGLLLTGLKKYEEAEAAFRRSFEIDREIRGDDHPELAVILNNLGLLYEAQALYDEAEQTMLRAARMVLAKLGEKHPALAPFLHSLGVLSLKRGQHQEAETLLRGSLILRQRSLREDDSDLALGYSSLAWALLEQGRWAGAHENFAHATRILTRRALREARSAHASADVNAQADVRQAHSAFVGQLVSAYELSDAQPDRRDELMESAFRIAQWARNSPAGVAVTRMAARYGGSDNNLVSLVRERQDLVTSWRLLDQEATAASAQRDSAQATDLRERLDSINERIREIDSRLKVDFEQYTILANPEPLSLALVQDRLRDDEAFVAFFDVPEVKPVAEHTLVWIVTKREPPRWYRVPLGTRALSGRVAALRCGLDTMSWRSTKADPSRPLRCSRALGADAAPAWNAEGELTKLPGFDVARSHDLYQALLSPAEDLIKDKQLLLVPSGPLTVLPFQVLVTAPPETSIPQDPAAYAKVGWLGVRNAITVLPSVASLQALRKNAKAVRATLPFVGFGNPLLTGGDGSDRRAWAKQTCPSPDEANRARLTAGALVELSGTLFRGGLANVEAVRRQSPLPETADEVCAVARAMNAGQSTVHLGERATEARVKALSADGTLANVRVAHFATHGLVADEAGRLAVTGGEPALMLTPPNGATEADDGLLTASEVAMLRLDADWVILSACNTAAGDGLGAEALSGLARAFLYAGARTLLVSHWAVNSNATVKLITTTATAAAAGPAFGKAEALRRAMVQLIEHGEPHEAHPAIWAPFAVVGEGSRSPH